MVNRWQFFHTTVFISQPDDSFDASMQMRLSPILSPRTKNSSDNGGAFVTLCPPDDIRNLSTVTSTIDVDITTVTLIQLDIYINLSALVEIMKS